MSKLLLLILYVAAGLIVAGFCVPLIFGWIGPNRWYGFRTPRTVADPKLWYPVNAVAGKRLAAAGITVVIGAIGFYFVPRWRMEHYALANLAVTVLAFGYAILQSARYLKERSLSE